MKEVLDIDILPKLLEDKGYQQDTKERRQTGAESTYESSLGAQSLVADEDADVHGKNAWTRLRDGNQVEQFIMTYPMLLVHNLLLDERYHSVAATDGEKAYLEECLKQFPHLTICVR